MVYPIENTQQCGMFNKMSYKKQYSTTNCTCYMGKAIAIPK